LLALAEGLVVVLLHDLEQRLFKTLLHTRRRRRRLCSVHPVPNAAACRSTEAVPFFFLLRSVRD
jgi:hypothetical protein